MTPFPRGFHAVKAWSTDAPMGRRRRRWPSSDPASTSSPGHRRKKGQPAYKKERGLDKDVDVFPSPCHLSTTQPKEPAKLAFLRSSTLSGPSLFSLQQCPPPSLRDLRPPPAQLVRHPLLVRKPSHTASADLPSCLLPLSRSLDQAHPCSPQRPDAAAPPAYSREHAHPHASSVVNPHPVAGEPFPPSLGLALAWPLCSSLSESKHRQEAFHQLASGATRHSSIPSSDRSFQTLQHASPSSRL